MFHFHIWCNLKGGVDDARFCESVQEFLSYLHSHELIEGYYIARRQFIIAPPDLGKFHITVEFSGTAQINRAFDFVSERSEETEVFHKAITEQVRGLSTALYKDFPEARRKK